jgi:hypothetical protein
MLPQADEGVVAGQHVDAVEHEGDVVELEILDPPLLRRLKNVSEIRSRSATAMTWTAAGRAACAWRRPSLVLARLAGLVLVRLGRRGALERAARV